jgi:23S rRNA (adenine2503-C2)-methyltransferase
MKSLLDYNLSEIKQIVSNLNQPKFRATQLFKGIQLGKSLQEISTLPKKLVEQLNKEYLNETVNLITQQKSKDNFTQKFLFKLQDNHAVECVLMNYKHGNSLCISTQVGCRMKCKFCASGVNGLVRNLTAGEMLAQVAYVNKFLNGKLGSDRKITNIVLMGTGEPLDNFDNVVKFLKLVNSEDGLNISLRNISLSTSGLAPQIKKLADENLPIVLTISLHSSTDETRKSIMPIANNHKIKDIMNACWYYFNITKRRVVFEYVLIKDVTTTTNQIQNLISLLKSTPFHLNLIMLNEVENNNFKKITIEQAKQIENELTANNISVTLRRTLGDDIDAACGQLRQKHINKEVKE